MSPQLWALAALAALAAYTTIGAGVTIATLFVGRRNQLRDALTHNRAHPGPWEINDALVMGVIWPLATAILAGGAIGELTDRALLATLTEEELAENTDDHHS